MKFVLKFFVALFLSITHLFVIGQTAKEIIARSEEMMRGKSSEATLIIKTIRPGWSREMRIRAWMKGIEHSMILVTYPARDKGIVFLKRGKEVWNWMPSIEKVIKLPPSMMSQSWMGTDFTNDDLVKESSILIDYTHSFSGDTTIDGRTCYKITLLPKDEAAVVWGRLLTCIDKERLIQLHTRFYDENNQLVNTMNATDVKMMDGRMIPTRMEMVPADKKNQRTEMVYEKVLFDRPIETTFFSTDQMRYLKVK